MALKLTKSLVEKLEAGTKPSFTWDALLPGFGVKVTPAGRKVYVVQFRPKRSRTTRRYTLGPHGQPWTVEKAREAASTLLARVRLGEDPFVADQQRRQAEQDAQRQALAELEGAARSRFQRVFAVFVERYAKRSNRSWKETVRIIEYDVMPVWRDRSIRSISRADVVGLLDQIEDRSPSSARAVHAQLRKFFNWCVERLYIELSPCAGLGSRGGVVSRDRWLRPHEIQAVWRAFDEIGQPFGPLFKLLLLTAQRRDEVGEMRWQEVNLQEGTWTIPASRSKNRAEHMVQLSPIAVELLRLQPQTGEFVFSYSGKGPVSGYSKAKARVDAIIAAEASVDEKTGSSLAAWRLHDLRRTAATGMARLGYGPHIVEAVLNHRSGVRGGLVAVYQHYDHEAERRQALDAWAAEVQMLTSPAAAF